MPLKISPRTVQVSGWAGGVFSAWLCQVENVFIRMPGPGWWTQAGFCLDVCAWMRVSERWGWVASPSLFFFFSFFFNYMFLTKRCGPWHCSPDSPPPLTTRGEGYRGLLSSQCEPQHQWKHKRGGGQRAKAPWEWGVLKHSACLGRQTGSSKGSIPWFPRLCFLD